MRKQNGLTMFELLITLSIIGILLTVAMPSLTSLFKETKLVNTMNTVTSMALFARSEAIKRGNQTILCRSDNNASCVSTGKNIIVISDKDNTSTFVTATDDMLKTFTAIETSGDIKLFFKGFTGGLIVFSRLGQPNNTGRIVLCDSRGTPYAKASILNMGGQLRSLGGTERSTLTCSV